MGRAVGWGGGGGGADRKVPLEENLAPFALSSFNRNWKPLNNRCIIADNSG